MSIKSTKTWREYKRLLRAYVNAEILLQWSKDRGTEEVEKLHKEMKRARYKLDAFMLTHTCIQAISSSKTLA